MPRFPLAAITDEFSPGLETALRAMASAGIKGAELRTLSGRNIIDLSDDEVRAAVALARTFGIEVVSIASPLLKCVLPDAPPVDARFEQDSFNAAYTIGDQPRLAARAFEIAALTGARIIRVFSYWRTVRPRECFDRIAVALDGLARLAAPHGVIIGIENEQACNVATGAETAELLAAVDHPNLQVVWDPANARVAGELPFPGGYQRLPPERIVHVHAKDCQVKGDTVAWAALCEGEVDWPGQLAALERDGYRGWISLETHWAGPEGDKLEASLICARRMREMLSRPTGE